MSRPTLTINDPDLLDWAAQIGPTDPVAVAGGRTHWAVGGHPVAEARIVEAPVGIQSIEPAEMVVTVRAGTTVAELHAELADRNQRTALPSGPGSTVGGALMVGRSSIHALGRGSIRQSLLMARYVTASGDLSTAGGPTVKNVTGFDVPRLLIGSLGTIGFVAEVMLRTQPIPPASQWITVSGLDPLTVMDRAVTASSILWDGTTARIHLEGHPADIAAQIANLGRGGDVAALDDLEQASTEPQLPGPNRVSLAPREAVGMASPSAWVELGVGVVHSPEPIAAPPLPEPVRELNRRITKLLDPTRRCNPGRSPWPV